MYDGFTDVNGNNNAEKVVFNMKWRCTVLIELASKVLTSGTVDFQLFWGAIHTFVI